jgi:hypothetical protein
MPTLEYHKMTVKPLALSNLVNSETPASFQDFREQMSSQFLNLVPTNDNRSAKITSVTDGVH